MTDTPQPQHRADTLADHSARCNRINENRTYTHASYRCECDDRVDRLKTRLYAALKHEKSCVCGECSGGLNAVDELVALAHAGEKYPAGRLRVERDTFKDVAQQHKERAERDDAYRAAKEAAWDAARAALKQYGQRARAKDQG